MKFIIEDIPKDHYMYPLNGMTFEAVDFEIAMKKIADIYGNYLMLLAERNGFVPPRQDFQTEAQEFGEIMSKCLCGVIEGETK